MIHENDDVHVSEKEGNKSGGDLTSVKSDGGECTGNVASPEARSCFHRP